MTQSNDLSGRVDRTENQMIDLQLTANLILQAIDKNSADIAVLLEVSRRNSELGRRNSEGVSALLEVSRHYSEAISQHSEAISHHSEAISTLEEAIQDIRNSNVSINATIERMDRLFDYLIRCDQGQLE